MLIKEFELNHPGPARDRLEACDPDLKTWWKLLARRYARHSESLDVVDKVEDVNATACNRFAGGHPGNSIVPGFFPSVRISP